MGTTSKLKRIYAKAARDILEILPTLNSPSFTNLSRTEALTLERVYYEHPGALRRALHRADLGHQHPREFVDDYHLAFHKHMQPYGDSSCVRLSELIQQPDLQGVYHYPGANSAIEFEKKLEDINWPYLASALQYKSIFPKEWENILQDEIPKADAALMQLSKEFIAINPAFKDLNLPPIDRSKGFEEANAAHFRHIELLYGAVHRFPAEDIIAYCNRDLSLLCPLDNGVQKKLKDMFGKDAVVGWRLSETTANKISVHLDELSPQEPT
ncbi:MAG: hypothetical protein WBK77_03065 [Alphaproteobacteria bacterium]